MATQTPAEFDFAAVAAKAEETEVPQTEREKAQPPNPFKDLLAQSFETETGRRVTVPARQALKAMYLVRQAANKLGIGVRIVVSDNKGETVAKPNKDTLGNADKAGSVRGNVTITFAGQPRRKSKTREAAAAESTEPTDDETAEGETVETEDAPEAEESAA